MACAPRGRETVELRGRGCVRPPQAADRRTRARRLHRRRRPRGARHDARRVRTTAPRPRCSWPPTGRRALRQAIHACRKGGTVSIPGVYGGFLDKMPLGAAFGKGPDLQDGADPRHEVPASRCSSGSSAGEIDPSFVITHRLPIDDAPPMPTRRSAIKQDELHQGRAEAALKPRRAFTAKARRTGRRTKNRVLVNKKHSSCVLRVILSSWLMPPHAGPASPDFNS